MHRIINPQDSLTRSASAVLQLAAIVCTVLAGFRALTTDVSQLNLTEERIGALRNIGFERSVTSAAIWDERFERSLIHSQTTNC
jgi:hypothetical protein